VQSKYNTLESEFAKVITVTDWQGNRVGRRRGPFLCLNSTGTGKVHVPL